MAAELANSIWKGLVVAIPVALGSSGCISPTLSQEYVYAMWERCQAERVGRPVELGRVDPDGTFWLRSTGGPGEHEIPAAFACMRGQSQREPYPDWLRNQPVRTTSSRSASRAGSEELGRPSGSRMAKPGAILWKWDTNAVPTPPLVEIVPPASSLPARVAAFSGAWAGVWSDGIESRLIVESIDANSASVVYAWGGTRGGWVRVSAMISPDPELAWGSLSRYSFRLREDGRALEGRRRAQDGEEVAQIELRKLTP
jgi:hypothetical protein